MYIQNLLRIMMAADGHPDVWEKICLLLERTVNAVGPRYDCFKTLLPALLKGVQDENELVQSVACCSALGRILVCIYFSLLLFLLLISLYIYIGRVSRMHWPSFALDR